ncbi:hypothetical protein QCA50_000049 [Cerrena zonata]|uniref:Major facilitator superfamily (MFS) profile domain-containing protein n=1 Tax=Cerrena zonata TaxID=2478898 RepID=A0AAW0GP85_9APHY
MTANLNEISSDGANELRTQDTTNLNSVPIIDTNISSPLNQSPLTTLEGDLPETKENVSSGQESGQPEKPYSVFTRNEKWLIVGMTAVGGAFSPLTANIYFPAIPIIGQAFNKSTEAINLTVTVYMILQGVSPMIWGPLADRWGRRLIFLACLLILALSCVGLALTPTTEYWLLIFLRCIQAGGSASTIAVGAGIIADVAARHERGGFYGVYNVGPMFGPCIGPVIGGALAQGLGWRSIFWFLCISSAAWFSVMLIFFPETLRAMVGDGSIPPPVYSRPLIPIIGRNSRNNDSKPPPSQPFANPLRLFLHLDVTILLFANGVIYAVFYGVTASISTLFKEVYPFLGETTIGLCFLSIGGGMLFGGVIAGKVLDREYRRMEKKLLSKTKEKPVDPESVTQIDKDDEFPIEKARFRTMPIYLALFIVTCAGYGWTLQQGVNIACPLILLIIMGYGIISILNTTQTLIVDLAPGQGSSITACNNLVRCSLGAALVSIIDIIIKSVGIGWAYVILAAMCLVVSPPFLSIMYIGPKFRAARKAKLHKVSGTQT